MPDRFTECGEGPLLDCNWDVSLDKAWIQYLDVGQGDGTFLYFPGGAGYAPTTVLIDLGSKKNAEVAGSCARQFIYCTLKKVQADNGWAAPRLDLLVLTHGDGDHYNLILPLVQMFTDPNETLTIGELAIGGPPADFSEEFRTAIITPMQEAKAFRVVPRQAHDKPDAPQWTFEGGKARLYILSANYPEIAYGPKNPKSIVLMLRYKGTIHTVQAIFMGDAEESVETVIEERYRASAGFLVSQALKLGHHGSQAGSSECWIKTVKPKAVFASADMKWAHPYCTTIERVTSNTTLWNDLVVHDYLCGRGSRDSKMYDMTTGTRLGVFANLTELEAYELEELTQAKRSKPKAKPPSHTHAAVVGIDVRADSLAGVAVDGQGTKRKRTATIVEMESVLGSRFQLAIDAAGGIVISQGALAPGKTLTEVFRRSAEELAAEAAAAAEG